MTIAVLLLHVAEVVTVRMTHNDVFVCTGVRPLAKAKKLKLARWTSYASRCIFTAEVLPYHEHWKRITKARIMIVVVASFSCSLLFLTPEHTRSWSHFSKTPGCDFLVHGALLILCSQKFQHAFAPILAA